MSFPLNLISIIHVKWNNSHLLSFFFCPVRASVFFSKSAQFIYDKNYARPNNTYLPIKVFFNLIGPDN